MQGMSDETASELSGSHRTVGVSAPDRVGIFEMLAEQHAQIEALLERAQLAVEVDEQRALWTTIRAELFSHECAELAEVYGRLEEYRDLRAVARAQRDELHELECEIVRLDRSEFGTDTWKKQLQSLTERVRMHVAVEEQDLFPRALRSLRASATEAMIAPFIRTKAATMLTLHDPTRPHSE